MAKLYAEAEDAIAAVEQTVNDLSRTPKGAQARPDDLSLQPATETICWSV